MMVKVRAQSQEAELWQGLGSGGKWDNALDEGKDASGDEDERDGKRVRGRARVPVRDISPRTQ